MICDICGNEVIPTKEYTWKDYWEVNVAIVGADFYLKGHRLCLENVEELVVFPNRARLAELEMHTDN